MDGKQRTADSSVIPVHGAGTAETVVSDAAYEVVGGYNRKTDWWWRYGSSEEERNLKGGGAMVMGRDKGNYSVILRGIRRPDVLRLVNVG